MKYLQLSLLSAAIGFCSAVSSVPASRNSIFGVSHKKDISLSSLFGVNRGGALFGGTKNVENETAAERPKYPAMSSEEIEDWLAHIPVFAVTDKEGQGVVLKSNATSVFYFFMNVEMANATMNGLKQENPEMDLQISAFSLGKIWFRIRESAKPNDATLEKLDEGSAPSQSDIDYRLVPSNRDILGARMLLTMDEKDSEELKAGGTPTYEMTKKIIEKAYNESTKFKDPYNEIPVFLIQQMRMQKKPEENEVEPVTILPMYFNLQDMVGIWQKFTAQSPDTANMEPAIQLMDLFEILDKAQEETEVDWRNVLLVPSAANQISQGTPGAESIAQSPVDDSPGGPGPGAQTLGDL
mmetsp:Transcript_26661/g.30779  ORF Transcript_26661/g.30779 Transcript_26661/m.30779 type:complete len:353 (+) Transcript_26661:106-1164(+)